VSCDAPVALPVHLDEKHSLRHDAVLTRLLDTRVLDRVFEVKERTRLVAEVVLVDEDRSLFQQISVPLEDKVDRCVE
jgi:hypothetical protein